MHVLQRTTVAPVGTAQPRNINLAAKAGLALPRPARAAAFQPRPTARALRRSAALPFPLTVAAAAPATELTISEETVAGDSSVRLTVTVPAATCKKTYRQVLKTWNSKIAVTGFRKGNAPDDVLIDQLGGLQRVYNTCITDLVEAVMEEALTDAPSAAMAIAGSERLGETSEQLEEKFDPAKDFTFTVMFDVLPSVAWTTPYKSLKVKIEASSTPDLDQAKADAKLRALLKEGAQMRVVADRGLQRGDVAVIDFDAALESGEAIPGAGRQGMQLDTEVADEVFMPGVAEAMEGMRAGEERNTTITFPTSEDFSPASLRGAVAAIKIKVNEVFEYDLPETTEEWAEKLMGAGSTVADVKARLLENTQAESEEANRQRLADAFTDAVAAAVEVAIPEALIQEAGQMAYSRDLNQLIQKGTLSYQQAEQLATPHLVASYITRKKEELVTLQKASLGFADILKSEGLAPSDAAVEAELASALAEITGVQGEGGDIDVEGLREEVVRGLETAAAMDWLMANCDVTVSKPKKAAAAKKKPAAKKVAAKKEEGAEGADPEKKSTRGRKKKEEEAPPSA